MVHLYRVWNPGIDKQMRTKLKTGAYHLDEVGGLYYLVLNLYRARMKAFKRVVIFMAIVHVIGLVCNWAYMEDKYIAVVSCLVSAIMTLAILIYTYYVWVVRERKQFMKGLREGYPELVGKYEDRMAEEM